MTESFANLVNLIDFGAIGSTWQTDANRTRAG